MKRIKNLTILSLILLASFFLRLYQLGEIPNGLSADEADMGYNSYSILKTGKDVYGKTYPLFFQSLDDYKPGFAIYSAIPAIKLFGLSDFSVRLVPALFGVFSPILFFVFLNIILPKNKTIPLSGALLMAIAPWHIAISRATLMYVELIFFYLVFLIFLQLAISKKPIYLVFSFIALGISLYVYYAAMIYLPFILVLCLLIYKKELFKELKILLLSLAVLFVVSLPASIHYASPESRSRLNAISVLTPDVTLPHSIEQMQYDQKNSLPFAQILHNRRIIYLSAMLDNYFDYFNLDYLFVSAKNTRYFYTNYVGLFYLIELPLFIYGVFISLKRFQKIHKLILSFLIIGPISAMITLGSPFPHRALLMLLAIQIIVVFGLEELITFIKSRRFNLKLILRVAVTIYGFSVIFYLHQYFIHSPREFISEFDNGAWFSTVRDAIPKVNQYKDNYDKIVFTWSQGKLVPPIYFLFYNKDDPRIFQTKAAKWTNESPSYKQIYNQVDNIEFRPINWEIDKNLKNTLFVGYPKEFTGNINVINKTYLPSGNEHFLLVGTD